MESCLLCSAVSIQREFDYGERRRVKCEFCGEYAITGTALSVLDGLNDRKKLIVKHILSNSKKHPGFVVNSELITRLSQKEELPTVQQQVNNLLLWLGTKLDTPEKMFTIYPERLSVWIGSNGREGLVYIASHLKDQGLVNYDLQSSATAHIRIGLTFQGWAQFEKLRKGVSDDVVAFMAMEYSVKADSFYENIFKPAVKGTGFNLKRLDEVLQAGLIDNQLRVAIRQSRFILADLSTDNLGAYWEAGYAEGLGKPVIYLCEKKKWDDMKTHFDTNHQTTIIWDEDDPLSGMKQLQATIRSSFPGEASSPEIVEE